MKHYIKLIPFLATLVVATSANAAIILLAGFDGNQTEAAGPPKTLTAPIQDASAVGNVTVALSTTSTIIGFDWASGFQSSTATWGSASAFTPGASIANTNAVYAHDADLATINMTITNTGSNDVSLDTLMMRVKRDSAAGSATGIRVTYLSGDLTSTLGSNSLFSLNAAASTVGYDFSLTGFMSDVTLAAGQTATFSWASEGGTGSRTRFDNIGLSGSIIPEPSSVLLGGISVLLLLRRRR